MRSGLFVSLFLFILISYAGLAQTNQFELSGNYTALNGTFQHSHGVGVNASYDFWRRLGFDAGITSYPSDNYQGILGQGSMVEASAGLRMTVIRNHKVAVFARGRPGVLRLSDLRVEFPAFGGLPPNFLPHPAVTVRHGVQTNFAFDYGGTMEFYPTRRTFIRADFGDLYVRHGAFVKEYLFSPAIVFSVDLPEHGEHQYKMSLGAGWRFGTAPEDRVGNDLTEPEKRWTAFAQYSALGIDGWRSGGGVQVGRRISGPLEWEAVTNVFPGHANDLSIFWFGQRVLQFQTGPAVQLAGGRVVSLKVHLRPGVLNFGDYILYDLSSGLVTHVGSRTSFNLNYGIAAEFNVSKKLPLRFEVSDNLTRFHGAVAPIVSVPGSMSLWSHEAQMSVGVGFRF